MLIVHLILAGLAVAALCVAPHAPAATAVAALAALVDALLGSRVLPALAVVAPLLAFLTAALTLAGLVERSGLADRVALALAARSRGSALRLFALTCLICALLTAVVSLDGAVVLMIPLLLNLERRADAPFGALFLGTIVVANVVSIAVPQGNPTNLVIIDRLGLSSGAFVSHMLIPGVVAAALCAGAVAILERKALRGRVRIPVAVTAGRFTREERLAAVALVVAGLAAWTAPLYGLAPWWPFAGAVALALAFARDASVRVPWRVAAQVGGLLIAIQAIGINTHPGGAAGLLELLAIALAVGAAAAIANNLPVSVCVTGLLAPGGTAYAASIGLAIGSIATRQGSVATLIATDLAGETAPALAVARFAPLAIGGVVVATALVWLML
jgi:arsenical pump membrane protein